MHVVRTGDGTVLGAGRLDALQMGVGPLHRLYETADGWIVVVAANDTDIAALGRVLGGVDILGDGRFATPQLREANATSSRTRSSDSSSLVRRVICSAS